jgi:hypothetical protein
MKNPLSKNRKQAGIYLSGNRYRPYRYEQKTFTRKRTLVGPKMFVVINNTWKTFRSYQLKWDYRFQYYMARYYTNKGGK